MKSLSIVEGSRERETRALMVAVLGMTLKVHDFYQEVQHESEGKEKKGKGQGHGPVRF